MEVRTREEHNTHNSVQLSSDDESSDSDNELMSGSSSLSSGIVYRAMPLTTTTSTTDPALSCLHCPYATRSVRRLQRHLESHGAVKVEHASRRIGGKPASASTITTTDSHPPPPTVSHQSHCPFCTYQSGRRKMFRHIDMHFDQTKFLRLRGMEVRYEHHWAEGDTVQLRSQPQK